MFEEFTPVCPAHFFAISADCFAHNPKKKSFLPSLSFFYDQPPFAEVSLQWSEGGLYCIVNSKIALSKSSFPDFRNGDSIELFIDTRDVKTAAFLTRYCHHFCFLPESYEENSETISAQEVTRFRGEESHPLANPELFLVETQKSKRGYTTEIFIPKEALFGYDPLQFDRLGFTYRINSASHEPQVFSVPADEVTIEASPSNWASLKLVK